MVGMEQIAGLALQQTLSPQMQQSLHILQAPMMELRQLVETELQANPVLEEEVPRNPDNDAPAAPAETSGMDGEWNEYFAQKATAEPWTAEAQERRQHFFDSQTRPVTLQQHLLEQLAQSPLDPYERNIASVIIGNIDERGYLRETSEEVATESGAELLEVEEVLRKVQEFDPPGVAARDLAECLYLQLQRQNRQYGIEGRIVKHHLDALGRRKFQDIARQLHATVSDVQEAAEAISQLEPRPGRQFSVEPEQIVLPDVLVEKDGDDYVISVNDSDIPKLRVGDNYKDMLSQSGATREVRDYLREKIRGGRFFIKCLEQRQHTMLQIAKQIVERQKEFFDHGPSHLRPMTMSQVAQAVGVHETTVSRAVSGKYMVTPRGLFEMKYFFTSGYTTAEGDAVSNESVRQAISEIIKTEDGRKPLSDQDIVTLLAERGLPIARRTVAKYREQLGILPSHLRKEF